MLSDPQNALFLFRFVVCEVWSECMYKYELSVLLVNEAASTRDAMYALVLLSLLHKFFFAF